MSFRRRLLLVSLVTLGVGLGALVVIGNVLLVARVGHETRKTLRVRGDAILATLTVTGGHIRVRETPTDEVLDRQAWVLDGDGVVERPTGVSPKVDRVAVRLGRARRPVELDGPSDIRMSVRPVRDPKTSRAVGAIVVGSSVEPLEHLRSEVLVGSLFLTALVLLAGGLVIRRAVDGALHPVAQMTERAEDWSAHDLDERFDLGPPRDELTGLAATLDGLLGRIAASRRHEQRFADDVAHELRTPLARLRGRTELALGATGPRAEVERDEALRAVLAQADEMSATIDALLAVARREVRAEHGVDLLALVHETEGVTIDAPDQLPHAEGEPEVIRRALAPLLDNARRHARSEVRLELSATDGHVRVAVRDDGAGLDPRVAEHVFEPGIRGPDAPAGGAGLGLALARRLARSCGGDVIVGSGPGGCFVLELPVAAVRSD